MTYRILLLFLVMMSGLLSGDLHAEDAVPVVPADSRPAASAVVSTVAVQSIAFDSSAVRIVANGKINSFSSFRLTKPARLVIDLTGVSNQLSASSYKSTTPSVSSVQVMSYPDKLRLIFDAAQGQDFPEAQVESTPAGLVLNFAGKTASGSASGAPAHATLDSRSPGGPGSIVQQVRSRNPFVEMIDFQVVEGISRVSVKVQGTIDAERPLQSPGFVTLTLKNTSLPEHLQRSLETGSFASPVLRITPLVVKNKNRTDALIRIAVRTPTAFDFRQESDMLFVDLKNSEGFTAGGTATVPTDVIPKSVKRKTATAKATDATSEPTQPEDNSYKPAASSGNYSGRKVTLEFADAEVRKIFQLLAEVSNKNFVLGDDVTGAISLKLVNVPWEKALDIILDTKGLDKREDGNIILIKGKGKFKSQAEEELEIKKLAAKSIELKTETFSVNYAAIGDITAQFEKLKTPDRGQISADSRTNKVVVKDTPQAIEDMRKILTQLDMPEKQVLIEARIVVATSEFSRDFGIQWGAHFKDGSASMLGINSLDTGFGGIASAPPISGQFGSSAGVATGISFGTLASNIQLDMRLSAAASASMVKVIATPKVVTLNHEKATIEQGQSTFVQTTSSLGVPNNTAVTATLKLEVKPSINSNNSLTLEINATDDSFGTPPPGATSVAINKRTATSKILLKDGETAVIGGIFREQDSEGDSGVPYLKEIPLLGKLFKNTSKVNTRQELLIFITPRVLDPLR